MNRKPILSFDEGYDLLAMKKKRELGNLNYEKHNCISKKRIKDLQKQAENNKEELSNKDNYCKAKSCEWANKITNVCCMPTCMRKAFDNGKE